MTKGSFYFSSNTSWMVVPPISRVMLDWFPPENITQCAFLIMRMFWVRTVPLADVQNLNVLAAQFSKGIQIIGSDFIRDARGSSNYYNVWIDSPLPLLHGTKMPSLINSSVYISFFLDAFVFVSTDGDEDSFCVHGFHLDGAKIQVLN